MIGMKAVRSLVAAVLALVVLAMPTVVLADGRVALLVGNSTYAHIGRLPNPDNDAADISSALRRLGFEVTTELDADRVELTEALRAFTRRSAGADVSLVFYAGPRHRDGRHQLPRPGGRASGARRRRALRDGDGRRPAGIDVGRVVAAGDPGCVPEQPAGALDAAHGGNPHGQRRQLRRPGTRTCWGTRRSSRMQAAAGTTAADGRSRNSPYTAALLSHLETPVEIGRGRGVGVSPDRLARRVVVYLRA